ncbi:MAG: putative tRNA pseudouridine synthase D [Methanosaeta sp. PtaB.Bin039]|nr:MAG: putative tRNA pseudouridine synthase D [Methanosaeta sp. PtaB.Bin039]OPY44674.1 MAG: putative tRNA pseudouridine synthase D [Methanosaeta sp. PtaU1.Bin028]HOT06746.1 tRNA pseudouridine(13) synthase TruD [Methanotrichaceae archaeon]HQF15943.1 tRNA pseudouridine(13) synthase TruD [Methanotrichaceae archaeon]HQI90709.1 tRNA pseudouridine(13) synthase TruD [Methanotrichaceae archaeon]
MIPSSRKDRDLGMDFYITSSPGVGGALRTCPQDFIVDEVFSRQSYEGGRYLVLEVEKSNWDTHRLIRELARALRISQKRISVAGTKDKRAVTRQRMSIQGVEEEELDRVRLSDVGLKVLGRTNRPLGLGDLLGNRFEIVVRSLQPDPKEAAARLGRITAEIGELGGVPNYFGVQRFGDIRPVTHLVGEALVRGDMELAVFRYLAMAFPDEPDATRSARQNLWESRDLEQALRSFPQHLSFELAMLNYLLVHPGDYSRAFSVLSPNLQRMFVHAYQSYIFNRILSRRLQRGLLWQPHVGDRVCYLSGELPDPRQTELVTEETLPAVLRLASRGRAFATLPLFGFQSELAEGLPGEIEREVISSERVRAEDFQISENPALGSRGTRRTALLPVAPSWQMRGEDAALEFFLPAGSYATVVLREYQKSESTTSGR